MTLYDLCPDRESLERELERREYWLVHFAAGYARSPFFRTWYWRDADHNWYQIADYVVEVAR